MKCVIQNSNRPTFAIMLCIIAGLAIALPGASFCSPLSNTQAEAETVRIIGDVNTVTDAYDKYYAQYGRMPLNISDLSTSGLFKTDYNNVTYLENAAGFNNNPEVINTGVVSQWATIISSAVTDQSTTVCKKINEKTLGLSPDAAVPEVAWTDEDGVHKFDAIPAEIKSKMFYCIKNGNFYNIVKIIRMKK